MTLTASQLARELGYSKGRITQLVDARKLDGAWVGEGRARRFDLHKVASLLNLRLDVGQQTGNGARHLETRARLSDGPTPIEDLASDSDARRLARARAETAEVQARQKRREEQLETGRYVLAEETERATAEVVARTLDAAERLLVAETRRLARDLGGNPAEAVAEMRRRWRTHRAEQARAFEADAASAQPTAAENAEMAEA